MSSGGVSNVVQDTVTTVITETVTTVITDTVTKDAESEAKDEVQAGGMAGEIAKDSLSTDVVQEAGKKRISL